MSRLLGRGSLRASRPSRLVDDEDDEEEESSMFQYGFRGGRKTAEGLFPPASSPVEAGVELERKGLFGRVSRCSSFTENGAQAVADKLNNQPGLRYDSYPRKRFSRHQMNINDTLRAREYRQPRSNLQRFDLSDTTVPNSPGTEVAKYGANIYCGQYSQDGSFFYTCAQGVCLSFVVKIAR